MRQPLILLLVLALSGAPAAAQTIRESARTAAVSAGLQATEAERTEMPRGLLWTGVGLMAGGGGALLVGNAMGRSCEWWDSECESMAKGFYVFGGIVAGTGAALFAIAAAKRRPVSPSLVVQRGRVSLQQRVTF